MIKKLLITLKYGEAKVKMYLIGVIVLLLAGIALMVLGISGNSLVFLGIGAVLLIAGLLVMFSFSFVDIDVNLEKNVPKAERQVKARKEEKTKAGKGSEEEKDTEDLLEGDLDIDFSMLEEDLSDLAIGVGGKPLVSEKKKNKEKNDVKDSDSGEENLDESLKALLEERENDDDYELNSMDIDGEDNRKKSTEKKKDSFYEVQKPTPKQIKARKKMLKTKKDDRRYTPVFVDSWKDARVLHTPAFVQDKGKYASITLVEGALRTELIPMPEFLNCSYQRNVEEKYMEVYDEMKNDQEVYSIFGELIPSLFQGNARLDSGIMYKNLYVLGGKIAITPRSLRKLFNKFDFDFHVFDSLDIRGKYSKNFKEAYESRIFWTDNVISQNDYQERIRRLLQSMVDDKELTTSEFNQDIEMMVRYNLITREYADYYKARKTDNIKIRI